MSQSPERIRAEVVKAIDDQANVRFMSAAVAEALPITIEHASVAANHRCITEAGPEVKVNGFVVLELVPTLLGTARYVRFAGRRRRRSSCSAKVFPLGTFWTSSRKSWVLTQRHGHTLTTTL